MSTVCSALSHIVAPIYTNLTVFLYAWPVASIAMLTLSITVVIRHMVRLGFRNCQSERSAHCYDLCRHLPRAAPRFGNDARVVCIYHSPYRLRPRQSLGLISPFVRPLSLIFPILFLHLGAYRILHHIFVDTKPLHRHTQYRSILFFCGIACGGGAG